MAHFADSQDHQPKAPDWREVVPDLNLAETYWGYVIRSPQRVPLAMLLGQALAGVGGIGCLLMAGALWLVPGASFNGDVMVMKLMGSALLLMLGALLLWFANRGTAAEWHIDTTRGEIREMLLNRTGRPSLLSRYGFDAIGGVVIDRVSQRGRLPTGHACLVLRVGNSAQFLALAIASESELAPLRDRLGRDLIVDQRQAVRVAGDLRLAGAHAS